MSSCREGGTYQGTWPTLLVLNKCELSIIVLSHPQSEASFSFIEPLELLTCSLTRLPLYHW